jgi:hypothetical protein
MLELREQREMDSKFQILLNDWKWKTNSCIGEGDALWVVSTGVETAQPPTLTGLHCRLQGRIRATCRTALYRAHSIATQRSIARDIVRAMGWSPYASLFPLFIKRRRDFKFISVLPCGALISSFASVKFCAMENNQKQFMYSYPFMFANTK